MLILSPQTLQNTQAGERCLAQSASVKRTASIENQLKHYPYGVQRWDLCSGLWFRWWKMLNNMWSE